MSETMRDPFAGKKVRIIVQETNDAGQWLDVEAIPLVRRGPSNAFSTGTLGWHGGGNVDMGRPSRLNVSITETGTKGLGTAVVKGDVTAEAKEARDRAKRQDAENFYSSQSVGRSKRVA